MSIVTKALKNNPVRRTKMFVMFKLDSKHLISGQRTKIWYKSLHPIRRTQILMMWISYFYQSSFHNLNVVKKLGYYKNKIIVVLKKWSSSNEQNVCYCLNEARRTKMFDMQFKEAKCFQGPKYMVRYLLLYKSGSKDQSVWYPGPKNQNLRLFTRGLQNQIVLRDGDGFKSSKLNHKFIL